MSIPASWSPPLDPFVLTREPAFPGALEMAVATGDFRGLPAPPPSRRGRVIAIQKGKGRRGARARLLAMNANRHG